MSTESSDAIQTVQPMRHAKSSAKRDKPLHAKAWNSTQRFFHNTGASDTCHWNPAHRCKSFCKAPCRASLRLAILASRASYSFANQRYCQLQHRNRARDHSWYIYAISQREGRRGCALTNAPLDIAGGDRFPGDALELSRGEPGWHSRPRVSTAPSKAELAPGEARVEDQRFEWHPWPPLFSLFSKQSPEALGWIVTFRA